MKNEELTENQEILNGMTVGLCMINRQRKVTWLNKISESWFGSSADFVGEKYSALFKWCSSLKHEISPAEKAFRDKMPHTSEPMSAFTKDGKKRYFRVTAAPILNKQGNVEKIFETLVDITDIRKREVRHRRRSAQTRKLNKEIVKLNKSFKNLVHKRAEKLKLANREIKSFYEIENKLISTSDVTKILESIVNTVPRLLKASGCLVRIVDETKLKLNLKAAYGVSGAFQKRAQELLMGEGISGTVARTGVPIAIRNISGDKRLKFQKGCLKEGMRSLLVVPITFKGGLLGTIIVYSKKARNFTHAEVNLLSAFAAHTAIALNNAILHNKVHINYYNTIVTLVRAVEARDPYTCGHSERVTGYALKIAKSINLNRKDMNLLMYAGKLHDIGKIAIPDFILKKKTALTPMEMEVIKAHSAKAVEMICHLKFLESCFPSIKYHHERYDGRGYPDGLKGNNIPFMARILSIADAFDAMTSERPYRKALTIEEAIEEMKRNSETQFDPNLVKSFLKLFKKETGSKKIEKDLAPPLNSSIFQLA